MNLDRPKVWHICQCGKTITMTATNIKNQYCFFCFQSVDPVPSEIFKGLKRIREYRQRMLDHAENLAMDYVA